MTNNLTLIILLVELAILLIPPILNWDKTSRGFVLAVRSLWLHKLRAALSVLGIVIGTSAVIALMAFGKGSMQDALEDIKRQGATNIIVRSVKPTDDSSTSNRSFVITYGLKFADLERFQTFRDSLVRMVPMRVFPSEVRYLERIDTKGRLVGTMPEYTEVNKLELAGGRFLTREDEESLANNCVLGSAIADKLFPFEDPLGKTVMIRSNRFLVVGVCADRMPTGGSGGSQAAEDFNHDVYIPFGTCRGLGAKRRVLVGQFLVEAVVQTTIGGLAGVVIGLAIVFGAPPIWRLAAGGYSNLPAQLSYWSIVLSVGVSVLVGVLFGL